MTWFTEFLIDHHEDRFPRDELVATLAKTNLRARVVSQAHASYFVNTRPHVVAAAN